MAVTQDLHITLPADLADLVRSKVANGEYDSESDLVRESLEGLLDLEPSHNPALEGWLRNEVIPASNALRADPGRALSAEDIRASLAALHAETCSAHELARHLLA